MSSMVAEIGRIHLDDLNGERRRYVPFREYGQAKLADLLMATRLAEIARERGWALRSIAAHPGYTRTNLQTAGANLGREKQRQPTRRAPFWTQDVEPGHRAAALRDRRPGRRERRVLRPPERRQGPTAAACRCR